MSKGYFYTWNNRSSLTFTSSGAGSISKTSDGFNNCRLCSDLKRSSPPPVMLNMITLSMPTLPSFAVFIIVAVASTYVPVFISENRGL